MFFIRSTYSPLRPLAAKTVRKKVLKMLCGLPFALWLSSGLAQDSKVVNIYTLRQPELLTPMLNQFTQETGIKVNATWVQNGILARLQAEGENSPADAILTVDVNRLSEIAKAGLFQPMQSPAVTKLVADHWREPNNLWTALTLRTRIIITSKNLANPPKTYEDLAKSEYQGKICIRPAKHAYNVGLVAAMIAQHGQADAKIWLQGLKNNLARKPQGNDRGQAKAIYEKACEIALINSYYLGKMATNDKEAEQKDWYQSLNIIMPNQTPAAGEISGAHANISGFGILKNAKNATNAEKLLTFLLSDEAQKMYASMNFELPVVSTVQPDELVASWGVAKIDTLDLQKIADATPAATRLIDELRVDF